MLIESNIVNLESGDADVICLDSKSTRKNREVSKGDGGCTAEVQLCFARHRYIKWKVHRGHGGRF